MLLTYRGYIIRDAEQPQGYDIVWQGEVISWVPRVAEAKTTIDEWKDAR